MLTVDGVGIKNQAPLPSCCPWAFSPCCTCIGLLRRLKQSGVCVWKRSYTSYALSSAMPCCCWCCCCPQVPPVLNQFVTRALDKNQAETLFKLLLKYR